MNLITIVVMQTFLSVRGAGTAPHFALIKTL